MEKSKGQQRIRQMVYAAVIAAAYTTLSMVLAPISFGYIQFRVAEALAILPVFGPSAIWGLTLGCAITNLIGMSTGANFLGLLDVFVGTLATLFAATVTYLLRNRRWKGLPVLSSLPPVLFNAVFIGAEWCFVATGRLFTWAFFSFAGFVALGQLGACVVLGLLLYAALEKTHASRFLRQL